MSAFGFLRNAKSFFDKTKAFFQGEDFQNLVSSLIGKYAGTNLTGAEREANEFTAQQAQINRDWQTEMSNTAFQRQVADMQAAGINPALAMSGSNGASTPSGAAASSVSPGQGVDLIPMLLNYKLGKRKLDQEYDLRDRQLSISKYEAETRRIAAESNVRRNEAYIQRLAEVTRGLNISNNLAEALQDIRKLQAQASLDLTEAQVQQVNQAIEESSWKIGLIISQTTSESMKAELYHVDAMLKQLDMKDKAIFLAYAEKLYSNQADSAYYQAQDDALRFAYDKHLLTEDAAKAVVQRLQNEGKLSQNAVYQSDLAKDVINNRNRPDKYKKQFSQREWESLREGLVVAAYPNLSANLGIYSGGSSFSYTPNTGQYVK